MQQATNATIRGTYRELLRLTKSSLVSASKQTQQQQQQQINEIRSSFRKPISSNETIEQRLQHAETRLSFLRMTTSKSKQRRGDVSDATSNGTSAGGGTWVYKDGQRLKIDKGTLRDSKGRVVSNWDGKNLDPESVTTHKKQLKRMGFTNNYHAKGVF